MTGEVSIEANGQQTYVEEVEVIDDYTVNLYLSSYYNLVDGATYEPIYGPAHYLKQFDPREDPSKTWADMNNALCNTTISSAIVDLPVLTPWKVTSYTENGLMIAERNPYYFKVEMCIRDRGGIECNSVKQNVQRLAALIHRLLINCRINDTFLKQCTRFG